MSLTRMPVELVVLFLEHLPIYDQLFTFGRISEQLHRIALDHHNQVDRSQEQCTKTPLLSWHDEKHKFPFSHNAMVVAATDESICAMDTERLICWRTDEASSSVQTLERKVSFDTQALLLPYDCHLILWDYDSLSMYDLSSQGFETPLFTRQMPGNKKVVTSKPAPDSNLTTTLSCTVDNFGQRYTELLDIRDPTCENRTWLLAGECRSIDLVDTAEGSQLRALVQHDGRILFQCNDDPEQIIESSRNGGFMAATFLSSPYRLAALTSSAQVSVFDVQACPKLVSVLGEARNSGYLRCEDLSYEPRLDKLLSLIVVTRSDGVVEYEVRVWDMESSEDVFLFSTPEKQVSRLEIVGWHLPLAAAILLLNGEIHCLVPGSPHQPTVHAKLIHDGYVVSGRLHGSESKFLTIGCANGALSTVELPTRLEMILRSAQRWAFL